MGVNLLTIIGCIVGILILIAIVKFVGKIIQAIFGFLILGGIAVLIWQLVTNFHHFT